MKRKFISVMLILALIIPVTLGSCGEEDSRTEDQTGQFVESDYEASILSCSGFLNNATIPVRFTCDGDDISPELSWLPGPEGTVSYALICEDPDAVGDTWVHWIIYNIPSDFTVMEENTPRQDQLENGALQGKNDFGKIGYNGPCPPSGVPHRYYFLLYALDCALDIPVQVTKAQLVNAMHGHILQQSFLVGLYGR